MQFTATFLALLAAFPFASTAPTSENVNSPLQKRQNIPNNINIGINEKRHNANGKGMWTAWVNGQDPCNHHSDLNVYEDEASPCNIRFSLEGMDYQYTLHGCGGDLSIWRNGKDNVGSCYWAPGHVGCVAGAGYSGRWQCHVNDGPGK
ncbi:hypothetical protein CC78DRAFT_528926 [Lojkania enalia]|uniref:Uncharacterized protein n=1 Tax=Lojkania enalia TaxID=147567 RepID=A0A9P4TPS6_9PLEO|nr:hypothetical protein CC78DRAFT_528926 [Didymosphaeria enalia]